MKPILVDTTQCHLWTDALHVRALAREAKNKWDRGTYVRLCVTTAWTALETSCQEALEDPSIGYSFRKHLDRAINNRGLQAIVWGSGNWQKVAALQEIRKGYVHRYLNLKDMFPDSSVADDAISVVRDAIKDIYTIAGKQFPEWVEICEARGWDGDSQPSPTICMVAPGVSNDDPNTRRVILVANGEEKQVRVLPSGYDTQQIIHEIIDNSTLPFQAIRVYDCGELVEEKPVTVRGN